MAVFFMYKKPLPPKTRRSEIYKNYQMTVAKESLSNLRYTSQVSPTWATASNQVSNVSHATLKSDSLNS